MALLDYDQAEDQGPGLLGGLLGAIGAGLLGYRNPQAGVAAAMQMAQMNQQRQRASRADAMEEFKLRKAMESMQAMQGLDLNSPDAPNKLAQLGEVAPAVSLMRARNQAPRGVPTGFDLDESGALIPKPMAGGGTYQDFLLQQAGQKAQIPGFGQAEHLDLARQAAERAEREDERKRAELARGKEIPPQTMQAYLENKNALARIDEAMGLVNQDAPTFAGSSFGLQNAMLPEMVTQRLDEQGVGPRAKIADIKNLRLHDMSGAAVTIGESGRFKPSLPDPSDSPEAIRKKLQALREEYVRTQGGIEQAYPAGQFRIPSGQAPGGQATVITENPEQFAKDAARLPEADRQAISGARQLQWAPKGMMASKQQRAAIEHLLQDPAKEEMLRKEGWLK